MKTEKKKRGIRQQLIKQKKKTNKNRMKQDEAR